MAVSQRDIASELGMSTATVSRSLNMDPLISPITRSKVVACAKSIGYRFNKGGKAIDTVLLAAEQSQFNIAAIVQTSSLNSDSTALGNSVLGGVSQALHSINSSLILHMVPFEKRDAVHLPENQPRAMQQDEIDGAILIYQFVEESVFKLSKQVPCVSVSNYYPKTGVDCVAPDNTAGISAMVDYLVAAGHSKIGYLSYRYNASYLDERLLGFVNGMNHNNLDISSPLILKFRKNHLEDEMDTIRGWIDNGVTALICCNDFAATSLYHQLVDLNYKVPEDVSITGFDNDPVSVGCPKLTTVDIDFEEIGRLAVDLMMLRINNPMRSQVRMIVNCSVKEGETVKSIG